MAALNVLATPEDRFDRVTRLSAPLFGVPMAVVALVDRDRWVAKSSQGLGITEMARTDAFCDLTIRQPEMLVIEDTFADERVSANPFVLGDPPVHFYAGQPLEAPGGHRVAPFASSTTRRGT